MSQYIPVYYLLIERSETPDKLEAWQDGLPLLERKIQEEDFYETISRNWSNEYALNAICETLDIQGLEFINQEIACLQSDQLETLKENIPRLIGQISKGIPEIPEDKQDAVWWLQYHWVGPERKEIKFTRENYQQAFELAKPTQNMQFEDSGIPSLINFYTVLKSLLLCANEAIERDLRFLYIQPQP